MLGAIAAHVRDMDLVVTTAQIPGRPRRGLITAEMVRSMRPGSVVVDLAGDRRQLRADAPGETVVEHGVTILGPVDLPSTVPFHASQMYGRNVLTLLQHLVKDGRLALDPEDEIAAAMLVVHGGEVRL